MANKMVIPSKEMARIMDNFEERIIDAICLMASDIKATYEDCYEMELPEYVSEVYYDCDYKWKFEELASEIIKEAYGYTFESDETSF